MDSKVEQFANQNYLNLETYKRSGQAVPTPVWFVQDGDMLYVRTVATSFKAKRIRNNPRVRVMPCGGRGEPKGEWVEGQARFADAAESDRVNQLLTRKYGLQKTMFEIMGKLQGRQYTIIAIQV